MLRLSRGYHNLLYFIPKPNRRPEKETFRDETRVGAQKNGAGARKILGRRVSRPDGDTPQGNSWLCVATSSQERATEHGSTPAQFRE
jgi:hypothetical protein